MRVDTVGEEACCGREAANTHRLGGLPGHEKVAVRKGARGTQGRQGRSLTRDCMLNLLEGLTGGAKPRAPSILFVALVFLCPRM